jgi:cytochrome c oxidase subunit 2
VETAGKERQIVAAEAYLRKSLLEPAADIVKGFPPVMPAQKGQITDDEIAAIIDYLKALK